MHKRLCHLVASVMLASMVAGVSAANAACTPTGFIRDSVDMTAALINPGNVVGQTIDATGCNIAIYYGPGATGRVSNSDIFGANYFGIVMDGALVRVVYNKIHDIGETPFNGSQHGIGVYCNYASPQRSGGHVTRNYIWNVQKGGIVVNGPNCVPPSGAYVIGGNQVLGFGPVNFIAQNGIQVGAGAGDENGWIRVVRNDVSGFSYSGPNFASSGGILVYGGCFGVPLTKNTVVVDNRIAGSDVGIYLLGYDAGCGNATEPTMLRASRNAIRHPVISNKTGNGAPDEPYQAGISEVGSNNVLSKNDICGFGYWRTPAPGIVKPIDAIGTGLISAGNFCSDTKMNINLLAPSTASRSRGKSASPRSLVSPVK